MIGELNKIILTGNVNDITFTLGIDVAILTAIQTFTNKTINATDNSITDSSQALGDILKNNGSKFVRFPRGTSLQVLRVNAGATDLEYATISAGGEINTSSNVGSGAGIAKAKNVFDLPFKSFIGELNRILIANNTDDLTFTLDPVVVATDKANVFGDFAQTFKDNQLKIESPNGLTPITLLNLQQTLARNLTIPIMTADQTLVLLSQIQTLANKTHDSSNVFTSATGLTNFTGLGAQAQDLDINSQDINNMNIINSNATFISTIGTINFGAGERIGWRNFANNNDHSIRMNIADEFDILFNGNSEFRFSTLSGFVTVNNNINIGTGKLVETGGQIGDLYRRDSTGYVRFPRGTAFQRIRVNSTPNNIEYFTEQSTIVFVIDGGGSVITAGIKGDIPVGFDCVITRAELLADQTGSIVIDIFKDNFASFPPTVGQSITASAKPTISSSDKDEDTTLTGWTTTITKGDILRFNVDSVTTIQRVTVALTVNKRG